MATTLPTPIEFRLPDDWRPAPPDDVGAPGAAFVALLPNPEDGFTANITIDGEYRPDAIPLSALADGSVRALRATAGSVTVLDRAEVGSQDAPGLTQTLRVTAPVHGTERHLVQAQVYLSLLGTKSSASGTSTGTESSASGMSTGTERAAARVVIRLVLTATVEQHRAVLRDFQWFVSTVRPEARSGG